MFHMSRKSQFGHTGFAVSAATQPLWNVQPQLRIARVSVSVSVPTVHAPNSARNDVATRTHTHTHTLSFSLSLSLSLSPSHDEHGTDAKLLSPLSTRHAYSQI